jgi:hypothetical protein
MVRNFIGLGKALLFLVTIGNSFLVLAIPHDTIYEIKKVLLVTAIMDQHKKKNFGVSYLCQPAQKKSIFKKKLLSPNLGPSD